MLASEREWVERLIEAKFEAMKMEMYRVVYETDCNTSTPQELLCAIAAAAERARVADPI